MRGKWSNVFGRRKLLALATGAIVFSLCGCEPGDFGSNRIYFEPIRYRLMAEVQTPEGVRSGSSVIETVWDRGLSGATVRGEAVAVDLPDGQTLFILLRTASNPDWAAGVPGIDPPDDPKHPVNADEREAEAGRQVAWMRANRDVHYLWGGDVPEDKAQYLPYMVRFTNLSDPKSIKLVAPGDLAAAFGAGYSLRSLTVQITDAPVTAEIGSRLPWLSDGKLRFVEPYRDPVTGYAAPRPDRAEIPDLSGLDFRKPFAAQ
jgi:hypothetical protein